MKIAQRETDARGPAGIRAGIRAGTRAELQAIAERRRRNPAACTASCPKASAASCSPHCPDMPRMLSSAPETYPLEGRIAPLVYELEQLEVFRPCWSCEGHNRPNGKLWKRPSVWFYCASVVPLRVLASLVGDLSTTAPLSAPWRVAVTFSDEDNPDTRFALEPWTDEATSTLVPLQEDALRIARALPTNFTAQARRLSRTLA